MAEKGIPLVKIVSKRSERGVTVIADNLPFAAVRAFWIEGVPPEVWRGGHAHKECRQLLMALESSFVVDVSNQKGECVSYMLAAGCGFGLLVEPGQHIVLRDFMHDTLCLVLASHPYDPEDIV